MGQTISNRRSVQSFKVVKSTSISSASAGWGGARVRYRRASSRTRGRPGLSESAHNRLLRSSSASAYAGSTPKASGFVTTLRFTASTLPVGSNRGADVPSAWKQSRRSS
jgi:hypothetical protein